MNAIGNVRLSKEFDAKDNFEMAIFHARRALNQANKFYKANPSAQIVLASFHYILANTISTYVECNVDEMNNLKPLELPDDDDEDGGQNDYDDEVQDKKSEKKDDDEPEIKSIEEKPAAEAQEEKNELEELADDIMQNFAVALQIISDFCKSDSEESLIANLLIDCKMREGEFAKFYQDVNLALENFRSVIKLCGKYPDGNDRIITSCHFTLGTLLLEMGKREESQTHLRTALDI